MSSSNPMTPPTLGRGPLNPSALADVIQWFLDHDRRVGVIRHPKVEELFHWKQAQARGSGEAVYEFEHAEDRLAIGIMQALSEHEGEPRLHDWISQLLNALDDAVKTNEEMAQAYKLDADAA